MKKIVLVLSLCFASMATSLFANDLAGIKLLDKCTKKQVETKFGKPVRYFSNYAEDFGTTMETFIYDGLEIVIEDSKLYEFNISKRGIKALTTVIKGGVQVGDDFSVLSGLKPDYVRHFDSGTTQYEYWFDNNEFLPICVNVKDNKIIRIMGDNTYL